MSSAEVKEQVIESLSHYTAEEFRSSMLSHLDDVDDDDRDVIVALLGLHKDRPQQITDKKSFLKWARDAKSADLGKLYSEANRVRNEAAVWCSRQSASQDKTSILEIIQTGESREVAAVARVLPDLVGEVWVHCVRCHQVYDIVEGPSTCIVNHSDPLDWERAVIGYQELKGRLPCCNRWVYPEGHPFDGHDDDCGPRLQRWEDEPCNAEEVDGHVTDLDEIGDPNHPAIVAARRACKECNPC